METDNKETQGGNPRFLGKEGTTRSRDFDVEVKLTKDSTNGDKVKAMRIAQKMTLKELSRRTGLTDRALRYFENNERTPSVDAVKRLSAAFGVNTDYFMDDEVFETELRKEDFLAKAKEKYGSRGKAQAKYVLDEAAALFAGGKLSEADRAAFIDEMEEIFWDSKEEAKKYTPKKYRKD